MLFAGLWIISRIIVIKVSMSNFAIFTYPVILLRIFLQLETETVSNELFIAN